MLDSFLTFINQQKWDLGKQRTLLAVSGGVDSVVLLQLFHSAGFNFGIAHCNFGLREGESDEDENFVRQLAAKYDCPVEVRHFETKKFAIENSVSTQMAARDLRYAWFEQIRQEHEYDRIATAHHANDALETVLLNLTRGTGLSGFHGVPVENGNIIRPLLFASRQEIMEYLTTNELEWREDRTNASVVYRRNMVRHQVVPVLKQINPSLEQTFLVTAERMRAADHLLETFMQNWAGNVVNKVGETFQIRIEEIMKMAEPSYSLWFILQNYGFGFRQVQQITARLNTISGKIFTSSTHTVLKDRTLLIIRESAVSIPCEGLIESVGESHFLGNAVLTTENFFGAAADEIGADANVIYVPEKKLIFPLLVRGWNIGDWFCPFGMRGKRKKLSDLLTDRKFSLFEKQKVMVLLNGSGEIIWVVGVRTDERFRINEHTSGIIKISLSVISN